eukprot:1265058-Prymnesium_polylepis.1
MISPDFDPTRPYPKSPDFAAPPRVSRTMIAARSTYGILARKGRARKFILVVLQGTKKVPSSSET